MSRFKRLDSLIRNAFSLMLTTGLTSVLGLLFWIVAARRYTEETVGHSSAEISGATLIATFAALNINAVYARLLPTAGVRTRWFVVRSYLVTSGLALAIGVGVLALGIGESFLGDSLAERAGFVLTGVLLLMFTLQDGVLVGLRRADVVLWENTAFAIAKLVALVALATPYPDKGIVVAWVGPVAIAVVAISAYVLRTVIPAHEAAAGGASSLPPRKRILSFVSAEYLKSVLGTGTNWALPLIVTAQLGAVQQAYFWIPWLINFSAVQLPYAISAAYVVEAAYEGKQSSRSIKQSLLIGGGVVGLCMLAEFFVVPLLLHFAGPGYAENGTIVIQILAISLPFSALNALYGMFAWIEQKLWWLVCLQAIQVVLLLGGSLLLMGEYGIKGVAMAYFVAQVVLGVGSIPPIVRRLRIAKERGALPLATTVVEEPGGVGEVEIDVVTSDDR